MDKIRIQTDAIKGHTHVELYAYYEKGDFRRPRGYYLHVGAIKVEGDWWMFSSDSPSQTYLVEQVERKNPKRFSELEAKAQQHAPEIAKAFIEGRYNDVWQYIS